MEEERFLIKGRTYTSRDPVLQDALASVYDTPERPRCLCVLGGIVSSRLDRSRPPVPALRRPPRHAPPSPLIPGTPRTCLPSLRIA